MKWLTQKEVKVAAKKSNKAAIACSVMHYEQILAAKKWEIQRNHKRNHLWLTGPDLCALCERCNGYCGRCPLGKVQECPTEGSCYHEVWAAYAFLIADMDDIETFRNKVRPMLQLLRGLQ